MSLLYGNNLPYHKVFVSYHHANDQAYRDYFEKLFAQTHDVIVSKSVQIGDIDHNLMTKTVRQKIRDEYLRDSTVTVVLIGSSIRQTQYNSRSGLLGIILPTYPRNDTSKYNGFTIPPRLYDNIQCGFAKIYNWSTEAASVQQWIHEAFERRNQIDPDNSFPSFVNNRTGDRWQK